MTGRSQLVNQAVTRVNSVGVFAGAAAAGTFLGSAPAGGFEAGAQSA